MEAARSRHLNQLASERAAKLAASKHLDLQLPGVPEGVG